MDKQCHIHCNPVQTSNIDPTLTISGKDDELPERLKMTNFGNTDFQTRMNIRRDINVSSTPGADIEVSAHIDTGDFHVDLPSQHDGNQNDTEGSFILGGASIKASNFRAYLDHATFYMSGGAAIESYFFWAEVGQRVQFEGQMKAGYYFDLNGGNSADITLNKIDQDGPL